MQFVYRLSVVVVGLWMTACTGGSTGTGEPEPTAEPEPAADVCTLSGVDVNVPTATAQVQGGGAPDASCIGNPRMVTGSQNVTLEGCVDIFGLGEEAKVGLRAAFYGVDQDPNADTPRYGEVDIATETQPGELQALAQACSSKGYFRIADIPTHTPLIVKVYDTDEGVLQVAIDTYTYDIVFFDEDIDNGTIEYEVNLIYRSTYDSVPTLGGKLIDGQDDISDGVGRAIIAGEIHDCQDRLVMNAVVGTDRNDAQTELVYFDGNEDPKPDLTRNLTNDDALYGLLNVNTDPGSNQHTVFAGFADPDCNGEDCECISLGSSTVYVFPDSVTILTLRGDLPVQQ